MYDRNGHTLHDGEVVKIIGRPDLDPSDLWAVFTCFQYGIFTDFILKNCATHEIKVVARENVQRAY